MSQREDGTYCSPQSDMTGTVLDFPTCRPRRVQDRWGTERRRQSVLSPEEMGI